MKKLFVSQPMEGLAPDAASSSPSESGEADLREWNRLKGKAFGEKPKADRYGECEEYEEDRQALLDFVVKAVSEAHSEIRDRYFIEGEGGNREVRPELGMGFYGYYYELAEILAKKIPDVEQYQITTDFTKVVYYNTPYGELAEEYDSPAGTNVCFRLWIDKYGECLADDVMFEKPDIVFSFYYWDAYYYED